MDIVDETLDETVKLELFKDIIPSILMTKENVFANETSYKYYVPYIVNRALSSHQDCIMQANQMNLYPFLDKKMQYEYYINSIRAYKRKFQPWHKRQKIEDLKEISEYFKFSLRKASAVLELLSHSDIDMIKIKNQKGGLQNDKSRRPSRSNAS